MKRRVAIFSVGGLGVGAFSEGLPTMGKIVERLADPFDVTFYSLVPTHTGFAPRSYRLRSPREELERVPLKGTLWLALLWRFLADHRQSPYDVLLSFWGYPMGTFVVALSRLTRLPSAAVFLGAELACLPQINYGELRRPLGRKVISLTCAGLSAVILVSTYQLDALRTLGARLENVHLIPWGADKSMFRFEPKTLAPPLKIVHVANLTAVKDQPTLVKAFAIVRKSVDAKLRFVGGDFAGGAIQALVSEMGLSGDVEFVQPVPHGSVYPHYQWADMFVLTSLSEGQNGALTEAVMCGVLAVSTPVGVASDLGDDAAVIVNKGDPSDIAAKIKAIAGDPAGWKAKVLKAREWSTAHDFDWTIDRMTQVLRDVRYG
jgi:glycosyltransferase involved in cell wall biosynthesis